MPTIKDSDLKQVISALESELDAAFQQSKATLVKAEGDDKEKGPPAEASDDSASPPASDSASPEAPAPAGPSADAAGSAPASPADAGTSAPPPEAGSAAPQADQALTPEALQAEYAQLPPEELDMHIQAALAAKEALNAAASAGQMGAAPGAGAMGASPSPAGPAGSPPPAMKQELSSGHKKANGGVVKSEGSDFVAMLKAEMKAEMDALKAAHDAEMAALKKAAAEDVEALSKAIQTVAERPERKAVTGISYFKKSEAAPVQPAKTYSPAEAKAKLNELIPTLSKSERNLILDYYSGKVKVDALTPIFDKIK